MSAEADVHALQPNAEAPETEVILKRGSSTFVRVAKYTLVKLVMLFFSVVIGIYLTIIIANMGGYVDELMKGEIRNNLLAQLRLDPEYKQMDPTQRKEYAERKIALEEKRLGLDTPFVVRSFRYLGNSLVLNLGRAQLMTSDEGSREVRLIILERLPPTLLLFGVANMILFFGSIFFASMLSRSYGSFWDKLLIALSPISSAPPWFYGIFLILIFAAFFKVLPFGGMIDAPPPETQLGYALSVLKHIVLPVSAILVSSMFISMYNWRTFFLIYSSEDFVEIAKAKGLSDREIERRYILRPTLPTIITSFSLTLISLWTGSILTETLFNWPGLGRTFFQAVGFFDTAVIVGLTIIYAYLLVITVFLLDFVYAIVDPRVKIGEN